MTAALQVMPITGPVAVLMALGLSTATFYRRRQPKLPAPQRKAPARSLSLVERQSVIDVLHEDRFVDLPPAEVAATLLSEGRHLCSERTMYRILDANHEVKERRNQLVHPVRAKPELIATGPNQVWSWDITKLLTFEKLVYLCLYVIIDIFSRYVVGWLLARNESAVLAKQLVDDTVRKYDVAPKVLTLHADRGAPMRSKLLAQLLADLEVGKSFNRPHTSNDNPFSESHFKTLKYHRGFPGKFQNVDDGRVFCTPFFDWYNNRHNHSGIAMLTPADVHFGRAHDELCKRHDGKMAHYHQYPERYVNGPPRLEVLPPAVYINPPSMTESPTSTGAEPAAVRRARATAPQQRTPLTDRHHRRRKCSLNCNAAILRIVDRFRPQAVRCLGIPSTASVACREFSQGS